MIQQSVQRALNSSTLKSCCLNNCFQEDGFNLSRPGEDEEESVDNQRVSELSVDSCSSSSESIIDDGDDNDDELSSTYSNSSNSSLVIDEEITSKDGSEDNDENSIQSSSLDYSENNMSSTNNYSNISSSISCDMTNHHSLDSSFNSSLLIRDNNLKANAVGGNNALSMGENTNRLVSFSSTDQIVGLENETFLHHHEMIVSNVGIDSKLVIQVDVNEKDSCKHCVNIVNSIQRMVESDDNENPNSVITDLFEKQDSEPCIGKHETFRPTITLSPQKHALFLKKKKMNRRESILNQVKLSSRLTGNKHSCRLGPAKRKDLSLEEMKNQRLDKKNNFHLELDLDILFTESLSEKLPIIVESSTNATETLFEMNDKNQSPTTSHQQACNFSCKYCNDVNRYCTINNSIKKTQHEVFNIVKYNLVKLKDLLESDDIDFEDSIDSVLESDCVQTLIPYLDSSFFGKYFSIKQESSGNCSSLSNLSMKDILALQLVATQVVKKLSCGRMDQVETLVPKLSISKLILLINSLCESIRYEALWIVGNLAKQHHSFRDDLLDNNVLNEIVTLIAGFSTATSMKELDEDTTALLRMAAWCFSKLCFGTVFPKEQHMKKEIELLDKFLSFDDSDILKNVCRALGRLMIPKDMIDVFLKTGRLPKIVDLLKHVDDSVIGQALVAAVNISAGTDEETQELVTLNALNVCHDILKSNKSRSIKVDAMILVSNICACTEKQVQCAVDCGVLELVASTFHNRDTHVEMKKEAVWIFSNATSNGIDQHLEIFTEKYQIIIPVAKMVMTCNDNNVITLGLQTLLRIVQYYDEDKEDQLSSVLAKFVECGFDKFISQMDANRYGNASKLTKYFTKSKN